MENCARISTWKIFVTLMSKQKEHCKEICPGMLQELDSEPDLYHTQKIITCKEIRIFQYDLQTLCTWKTPTSLRITEASPKIHSWIVLVLCHGRSFGRMSSRRHSSEPSLLSGSFDKSESQKKIIRTAGEKKFILH